MREWNRFPERCSLCHLKDESKAMDLTLEIQCLSGDSVDMELTFPFCWILMDSMKSP